jgi:hypothetical protein
LIIPILSWIYRRGYELFVPMRITLGKIEIFIES